jgi:hypothetical protein
MAAGLVLFAAAERSSNDGLSPAVLIAGLALLVAGYGAWLSTRNYLWQRKREDERRESDIRVTVQEKTGFDTDKLVIGETVGRRHTLQIGVINGGEAPEYVYGISLEGKRLSPITVIVRKEEGSVEVRPRDQEGFEFELDGSQPFPWDEPMRVVVRLANGKKFRSPYFELLHEPHHGRPFVVPDPAEVPSEQVHRLRLEDLSPEPE